MKEYAKNVPYTKELDIDGNVTNLSKEKPFENNNPYSQRGKSKSKRFANNRGKEHSLLVFPKIKYHKITQMVKGKRIDHLIVC